MPQGRNVIGIKDHYSSFCLTHFPDEKIIILADQVVILFTVDVIRQQELTSRDWGALRQGAI